MTKPTPWIVQRAHQAWGNANRELGAAIQSLHGVVASAMKAETQKFWIIGAATAAALLGFGFGTVIPTRIAQSVPESWHWPEQRAARQLQRGEWDAGMRMLQIANPARLRALDEAVRLAKDNTEVLEDCRACAAQLKDRVKCRIELEPPVSAVRRPPNGADWRLGDILAMSRKHGRILSISNYVRVWSHWLSPG